MRFFLKNLCTNKRKLKGDECIVASENVSALLQRKIPLKCENLGMFTIPCKIEQLEVKCAMLDLGVEINVMPKSIYNCLNLAPLKNTGIIIQLANRTHAYPGEIIDNVLVQVNDLIFPIDFYVLEMHDEHSTNPSPLLLGRPFMCTVDTKIDVKHDSLTMEFDEERIEFKIFDAIEHPPDSYFVFSLDVIDFEVHDALEVRGKEALEVIFHKYAHAHLFLPETNTRLLPLIMLPPELELKTQLNYLKYSHLGDCEILPVIISSTMIKVRRNELKNDTKYYM
ncbi:uncharacterized protein LOC127242373 [Andrographis paniculata]|uniref:uncharacterized protein LOC127242373 n=1 Tax=Andrographis paniculata TaxID=175694 RepID=UPI0021E923C3|nr:uncharacterized protein LOC127242373 [Andrographis paniculata]